MNRTREEFVDLASDGPCVVHVAATLDVDVDPLSAYAALVGRTTDAPGSDYSFLLESAGKVASSDPDGAFTPDEAGRHARFSFVGYDPAAVVTAGPDGTAVETLDPRYEGLVGTNGGDVVDSLREALPDVDRRGFPASTRQHLDGGLVGFLAYDAVYDLWLEEVGVDRPDSRFPDAQFVLNTKTLVFDEEEGSLRLVCTPIVGAGDGPGDGTDGDASDGAGGPPDGVDGPTDDPGAVYDSLVAEVRRVEDLLATAAPLETGGFHRESETAGPQAAYEDAVERAKEHVLDGDVYQGVVSRTRELRGDVDPLGLYRALREVNPSPYMYLLGYDDLSVVGASPETLVSVHGREVTANPIAGTCDRGSSPVEDRRLAGEMLADGKERAEHTMLVDLARNDVRRVSEPGSVRVEEFMNVLKYSHVQHIESTVAGRLAEGADAFDATRAAFPAGTLSGAPKIRAMEIIDDLERGPRGLYGGGVGYYSWNGDADFAIVIRTATVEAGAAAGQDRVTVQAGAGIVADSDPASEFAETERKMDGVLSALDDLERGAVSGSERPAGERSVQEEYEEVSR